MLGAGILSFKALIMEIKRKVNVLNLKCGLYSEVLFSIVSLIHECYIRGSTAVYVHCTLLMSNVVHWNE